MKTITILFAVLLGKRHYEVKKDETIGKLRLPESDKHLMPGVEAAARARIWKNYWNENSN